MLEWISNLFRRERPSEEDSPSHTITRDGIRAAILTGTRCCGHDANLVEIQRWSHHDDEWHEVALLFEEELRDAMDLLGQAKEWLEHEQVVEGE